MTTTPARMQQRRRSLSSLKTEDPTPASGEVIQVDGTHLFSIGDGSRKWSRLGFAGSPTVANLRAGTPSEWTEIIFNTDDTTQPTATIAFEHGKAVCRGSGSGTGAQSNRRSCFIVPGSPGGHSRIRSRWSGTWPDTSHKPEHGHAHGVGVQADGKMRAAVVWHDILFSSPQVFNLGIWQGDSPAGDNTTFVSVSGPTSPDKASVSAAVRTSNVVTLTVPSGHGFVKDDVIFVDLANASYDGSFVVSSVTSTTIVYSHTGSDLTTSTGTVELQRNRTNKGDLVRQVAVTDAARTSGVVTATVPANHGFQIGDHCRVDLTDATYDGRFFITELPSTTQIRWRQDGVADDASSGTGLIEKVLPYWLESEWLPFGAIAGGMLRARAWPDIGINGSGGPMPGGPPPWESSWAMTATLVPAGSGIPDPALGTGCGILAAHLSSGSTITATAYDSIECEPVLHI